MWDHAPATRRRWVGCLGMWEVRCEPPRCRAARHYRAESWRDEWTYWDLWYSVVLDDRITEAYRNDRESVRPNGRICVTCAGASPRPG